MNLQLTIHPEIVILNRFSIQRIVNRDVPTVDVDISFEAKQSHKMTMDGYGGTLAELS